MAYDDDPDPEGEDTAAEGRAHDVSRNEEGTSLGIPSGEAPWKAKVSSSGPIKTLLDLLTKKVNKTDITGPKMHQGLPYVVLGVLADGMVEDQMNKPIEDTARPDNCEGLDVPAGNGPVFDKKCSLFEACGQGTCSLCTGG